MRFSSRLAVFFGAAAGFLRLSAVAEGAGPCACLLKRAGASLCAYPLKRAGASLCAYPLKPNGANCQASAPRGPDPATLAGNPVQSLPRAAQRIERFRLANSAKPFSKVDFAANSYVCLFGALINAV